MSTPKHAPAADTNGTASRYVDLLDSLDQLDGTRDWVVDGAIESNPIVVLSGPEKRGKSWMLVDLATSVASATPWLNTFPVPRAGNVVVVDGEYGALEWARRAKRVCAARGLDVKDVFPNIRYYRGAFGFMLDVKNGPLQELVGDLKRDGADLIIVDPFRNFLEGDENSATDVLKAMRVLASLRGTGGCPVVCAAHLNKSGGLSGSRAIRTRADVLIEGSDEEQPWFSTTGRTLRAADAISKRFTVQLSHENDHDDRIASTTLRLRFEGETSSKASLSKPAMKMLAALKQRTSPTSANQLGKECGIQGGSARSRALRELEAASLARCAAGKWSLETGEYFETLVKGAEQ